MKKNLILTCVLFAFFAVCNAHSQTPGKDAVQACITAMKIDKMVDSFQTMSVKFYVYQQGQKVIIKYLSKDKSEEEQFVRFEQSMNGKEEAYVYLAADEEFFKVAPQYEELSPEDAGMFFQLLYSVFPYINVPSLLKDTTGKLLVDIVGSEEFEGRKCKKIGLGVKDSTTGEPKYHQYLYTDEVSNFLYGVEMPENNVKVVCENMKKVKGVVYPATVKVLVNGTKQVEFEIDKIEANIELDDALFAKPN